MAWAKNQMMSMLFKQTLQLSSLSFVSLGRERGDFGNILLITDAIRSRPMHKGAEITLSKKLIACWQCQSATDDDGYDVSLKSYRH